MKEVVLATQNTKRKKKEKGKEEKTTWKHGFFVAASFFCHFPVAMRLPNPERGQQQQSGNGVTNKNKINETKPSSAANA